MARYVRQSSYRHVFGTPSKNPFLGFKGVVPSDGNLISGNTKYFALPQAGGGGPVAIHALNNPGRVVKITHINVHKYAVNDTAFHPFIDNLLYTGDDAGIIALSKIPDELTSDSNESLVTLSGHSKKIAILQPHPVANNILASTSYDKTVKIWDIDAQAEVLSHEFESDPLHIEWNRSGSLAAVALRDAKWKLVDPRDAKTVQTVASFTGIKKSSITFADNHGLIIGAGQSKSASRELKVWDPRNLGECAQTIEIDNSNGVFNAHYDPDNSIFWLAGKGDSTVKYYEIVKEKPYAHFLSQFQDNTSNVGGCFLPKRYCDVTKCEIAVFLRLIKAEAATSVVPVSFQVPRKSDLFQKDLYPDAYAGVPALEAKEWLEGKNAEPKLRSMKPGAEYAQAKVELPSAGKKSYAELEAENEALKAKVKELEAQLAAK